MKLELSHESFDQGLEILSKKYRIFAPKRFAKRGTFSDTDLITVFKYASYFCN